MDENKLIELTIYKYDWVLKYNDNKINESLENLVELFVGNVQDLLK